MNVVYEKKPELKLIGYWTKIAPNEGYVKCPEFWQKEYAERFAHLFRTGKPENDLEQAVLENQIGAYAVCAGSEEGFQYWIAGEYRGGKVPAGMEIYTFPASDWAVFPAKGKMPDSLQQVNTAVWNEWFPNEGQRFRANGNATVEFYSAGDPQSDDYECAIWVPVILPESAE